MDREPGLSPRVRGNPVPEAPDWIVHRSIPACTGEPPWPVALFWPAAVYPRVYGGTWEIR